MQMAVSVEQTSNPANKPSAPLTVPAAVEMTPPPASPCCAARPTRSGDDGAELWEARIDRGPPVAVLDRVALMAWPEQTQTSVDLHPDGDRFIATRLGDASGEDEDAAEEVRAFVVTNWFEEMRARLGGGG